MIAVFVCLWHNLSVFMLTLAAADIAHSDAVRIMPCTMSTNKVNVATFRNRTVAINNIVITDISKASGFMPCTYVVYRLISAFRSVRTMNYYLGNRSFRCL